MKKFLCNGFILIITSLIIQSITMSFNVYIANKVGAECIGVFQILMSIYMFAITMATSGINLATTRIVSEDLAINSNNNIKKTVKSCLKYSLFFGTLTCILLCIFANIITTTFLHSEISPYLIYILAISLPFVSVSFCINGYFSGKRKIIHNSVEQIIEQLLKIIATTYLISLFLPSGINYACLSLVLGGTIAEILSCLYFILIYNLEKSHKVRGFFDERKAQKRIMRIALPIAFTRLSTFWTIHSKTNINSTTLRKKWNVT